MRSRTIAAILTALIAVSAHALELNRYFTDDMVIQREKRVMVKGTADKGAEVTVSFAGQKKSAKADGDGVWQVVLGPLAGSAKGSTLTAESKGEKVSIDNVVVGDVFLHARQTSIDITLGRDDEGKKAASSHKKTPMFRAISVKTIPSAKPLSDLAEEATTGWTVVDEVSAFGMTASAYYLGRDLGKDSDVPVGIIDMNLGSRFVNGWISREALAETGKFYLDKNGKPDGEVAGQAEKYETKLEAELKGEPYGKSKEPPKNTLQHPFFPSAGYNGTLNPLAGVSLKAAVVQLGNDYPYMRYEEIMASDSPTDRRALDAAYAYVYDIRKVGFRMESKVVPRVTREWRKCLGDKDLPFGLIVPPGSDLNTYGQHNREMRELQRWVSVDNPNVGIILPGSQHISFSGQPADEALIAARAESWIKGAVYEKPDQPATGPLFDRFEADFNEATIYFKEGTAVGLKAKGDALDYFEAANVEGDYYPVEAKIDGETISIESEDVTRIARVRYNWNHHPNQELVNSTGLPAIPFRSERAEYHWLVRNDEEDLPDEYFMPANEWPKSDVTLINATLEQFGYGNFASWIGPAGFKVGPFGPNMGVGEIKKGSPADGKLFKDDVIYSANGKMLGDKPWEVMAAAITESETRDAGGKLLLGVRRGADNIDVELQLAVMGRYSSTAPYDCPKTEKIVANLEKWLVETGGDPGGRTGADFLGADSLFLLATGNPEYLGLVRRAVYKKMADSPIQDEIDPRQGPKAWFPAWDALLLGEYYMATGDRNVLPHLKFKCDQLAAKQHEAGGWRHNYPGGDGYGLMPALGVAGAIGFHLANDAALDISQEAYRKVIKYYGDQAAMGRVIYGVNVTSAAPPEFDPEKMRDGKMSTFNGAVASAAILSNLEGDTRVAHLCSTISGHAWNNTFEGHGGNFWNNFWTPLGAKVQGKRSHIDFWKKYRWYRECGRMFDGSLIGGGKTSAGYGIALVAPRERLQIVGAPPSPFAADAPEVLKPALAAYWKKDYALAEKLANELIASGTVGLDEMPTVKYFARAAKEIPLSIDADIARIEKLIEEGDLWGAKGLVAGLKGVLPEGDKRTAEFDARLADVQPPPRKKPTEAEPTEKPRKWFCLVTDNQFAEPPKGQNRRYEELVNTGWKRVEVPEGVERLSEANIWSRKVLEDISKAPEGWYESKFDDSDWLKTELPVSWHMYHTALLRTTFDVEDKSQFDLMRVQGWVLRQQGIEIYLNGELIAKMNEVGKTTELESLLKESALKHLKNGKNTLALSTRHNWRWGRMFMDVYNDGFDLNLDARLKEE